jgi:SAM-dependent methyltransferase
MCHISCTEFVKRNFTREELNGKRIIEIGSANVNGSVRPIFESLDVSEYVGIDFRRYDGVDIICNAENMMERFGKESFDIVVSTSFLEHAEDWKKVISNIKDVCKKGGIMLHTTVSKGYGLHEYPQDFWRFELEDMKNIFSDCEILLLEKDTQIPGSFIKVRKKEDFVEKDLSDYRLYNILSNGII